MNKKLFFKTPEDKYKVFQKPKLIMFSEGSEVEIWHNTQPIYFYPFSWLDYLGKEEIRELYIQNASLELARKEINALNKGKVHFEQANEELIKFAKERGHKVSVICNMEELLTKHIEGLSISDFVKVRINRGDNNLSILSGLPNEHLLSSVKLYIGEGCDYWNIALQIKDMGFDFLHITKKLINNQQNSRTSEREKEQIKKIQELEDDQFRVIIPSSLEERFAKRFLITSTLGNVSSCDFSKYRLVLKENSYYPCYTQEILSKPGFTKEKIEKNLGNCLDCACIYENDMFHNIKNKMKKYKNLTFALEYI